MLKNHWRDLSGNCYNQEELLEQIKLYSQKHFDLYIGTDSKIVKNKIHLVSAICFHQEEAGSSGRIFYFKEIFNRKQYPSLYTRMLLETLQSLEIAQELEHHFSGAVEIHLDLGDTHRSKTADYQKELQAIITGHGFPCQIKPYSFASSSVADHLVKN